jgi:hypothetical protein
MGTPSCHSTLLVAALLLAPSALAAQGGVAGAGSGPAVVGGRIVDHETGRGVAGATVSLALQTGGEREVMARTSDAEGRFEFRAVPAGRYALTSESLGYRTFDDVLDVGAGTDVRLEIRVSASPLDLEPIVVVTARRPDFMDGFEARRARDRRHTAFFTAEEIAARNPNVLSDLFLTVPGAYVQPGLMTGDYLGNNLTVSGVAGASSRGCQPDVFVNGFLAGGIPYDQMFEPDQIEAVELYTLQHEVPQRFEGPGRCGALVIWLRDRDPSEFLPSWLRWLAGAAALGATFLLTR